MKRGRGGRKLGTSWRRGLGLLGSKRQIGINQSKGRKQARRKGREKTTVLQERFRGLEGCALGVAGAGSRGARQVPVGDVRDVTNAGQGSESQGDGCQSGRPALAHLCLVSIPPFKIKVCLVPLLPTPPCFSQARQVGNCSSKGIRNVSAKIGHASG